MSLGELILNYIKDHDLTYETFAEQCGLSKGYISMLTNNRNPRTGKAPTPSVETYKNLGNAMGMSLTDLLRITECDTPSFYHVVPPQFTADEMRLVDAYRKALPVIREAALQMLENNPAQKGKNRA